MLDYQPRTLRWAGAFEVGGKTMNEIENAISRSINTDSIVHLPYTDEGASALLVECDDSVQNGAVWEFWGSVGHNEWRVHLDM